MMSISVSIRSKIIVPTLILSSRTAPVLCSVMQAEAGQTWTPGTPPDHVLRTSTAPRLLPGLATWQQLLAWAGICTGNKQQGMLPLIDISISARLETCEPEVNSHLWCHSRDNLDICRQAEAMSLGLHTNSNPSQIAVWPANAALFNCVTVLVSLLMHLNVDTVLPAC